MSLTEYHSYFPTADDALAARDASRILASSLTSNVRHLHLKTENNNKEIIIPMTIAKLLVDLLAEVSQGHAVTLIAEQEELSTQEAANLLLVSRPYLIKLLESGAIPFYKVGKHRRVKFKDILAYKEYMNKQQIKSLGTMAEEAQKYDLGY